MKNTYIIVDGNSFIHRAYNVMPSLTNKDGFPTQIITGVCNMIKKIMNGFEHSHIVVAFDAKGKNFRHEMYPLYKSNRPPMPDDMRVQLEPLKQVIAAWGIPTLTVAGVEADDSMSSLALKAASEGFRVIMATSDKDMTQIVNEDIYILDTKSTESKEKMTLLDQEGVFKKFGVSTYLIVDYLALVGDVSDSVPGVHKCGEKTAVKWLEAYGNIDGIIENKDSIGGKVGTYLKESIDNGQLLLSKALVTIKKDVELGKSAADFTGTMDEEALISLFNQYELRGLKKALNLFDQNAESAQTDSSSDENEVILFLQRMNAEKVIFLQTFSFKNKDYLLGTSKDEDLNYLIDMEKYKKELSYYVASVVNLDLTISSIDSKNVIKKLFEHTQNMNCFNVKVNDARVLNYIQYGGKSKIATIEMLNDVHCNFNLSPLREEYKLNSKTPKWDKMTLAETVSVLSEEVKIGKSIILNNDVEFHKPSLEIDNALVNVLSHMEYFGVKIDVKHLEQVDIYFEEKVKLLEKEIFSISKEDFNIASPKQVAHILFEVLGIESKKKSTAEDVLSLLAEKNPIVNLILEWRSLTKLRSTYIDGLISRADNEQILHTTYNLTLTGTSRLSSTDPNLQNIPIKTEDGRKIRAAFIPKDGYKFVVLDYSQIELRILAHLSQDKKLLEAYVQGKDLHAITASEVFEIDVKDVSYNQRRIGKAINFGLIYGMSERRLAAELGIDKKDATIYYRNYFRYFKDVKPYFEMQLEKARADLFVETVSGRKIFTTDLNSPNSHVRSHAEKAANNASIQGTASDIIKDAMLSVVSYLEKTKLDARLVMQVHDELIFEVQEDIAEGFSVQVKELMERVYELSVPLIVSCDIRSNLSED